MKETVYQPQEEDHRSSDDDIDVMVKTWKDNHGGNVDIHKLHP